MKIYIFKIHIILFVLASLMPDLFQCSYQNEYKRAQLDTININSKYIIRMSLPKDVYCQYEPVMAMFTVINNDSIAMEIYDLFSAEDGPAIRITNESGKTYPGNKYPFHGDFFSLVPTYTVQPNETLYVQMAINNWGKPVKKYTTGESDAYFSQWGYFPPGRYKAVYYLSEDNIKRYGTQLFSNVLCFDVIDNESNDKKILELLRKNKNKPELTDLCRQIINDYPSSQLIEHVEALKLIIEHIEIFNNKNYRSFNNLEANYENFMQKYPDSYYLLTYKFLSPYVYRISLENPNEDFVIQRLKNKFSNDMLNKLINTGIIKRILNNSK